MLGNLYKTPYFFLWNVSNFIVKMLNLYVSWDTCKFKMQIVFQMGEGFIFKWGVPHGRHQFWWGRFRKNRKMGGGRGQKNLIRYTAKFETFVWSNFLKIWHALIHQISWMKNIKSNFKSPQRRKNEKIELQMNQHEIFL